LDPLILKGFRRGLVQNDLYVCPPEAESKHLLHQFNRHWAVEQERSRGPRLWIAIAKCLLWRLIAHDILTYINMTSLTCQSLLVGYLASYFTITNPSYEETRNAYLFATGLSLISFFLVAMNAMDGITGYKMSMHVRVITSSAIYQKILKLSQSVVRQLTVGHIINLASNDVHRFDRVFSVLIIFLRRNFQFNCEI
jgi:ATP-binding cassette subfamily C (CFTR/MRP) protein 4